MKRSKALHRILILIIAVVMVIRFVVPPDEFYNYEVVLFWVVMPVMGCLWIQAYMDGMKGN